MLLLEAGDGLGDLIERPHLVERETDDTGVLGDGLEDRLTDPPHSVGDELEASRLVEFLRRLNQP